MDIRGIGVVVGDKTKFKIGDYLVYTAPTDGRLVAGLVGGFVSSANGEFFILLRGTDGPYKFTKTELVDYEAKTIGPEDLVSLFNALTLKSRGQEQTIQRVRDALSGTNS